MAAPGTLTYVLEVAQRVQAAAEAHAASIGEAAAAAAASPVPGTPQQLPG